MSFDYKEIRAQQQSSGTQWASYSDLFMVLAFVFLLLYMVSSLRTGMISVTARAEVLEVRQELELYKSIKDQYLTETNSEQEQKIYDKVIQQIALLESDASDKKQQYQQQMQQQAQRESALNEYQQMILSMVNANAAARADAIEQLRARQQQNEQLQQTVAERSADVEQLQQQLEQEVAETKQMQQQHAAETQQQALQFASLRTEYRENQDRLQSLERQIQTESSAREALEKAHEAEKQTLDLKYAALAAELEQGQSEIASLNDMLAAKAQEQAQLEQSHQQQTENLEAQFDSLKSRYSESQTTMTTLQAQIARENDEKAQLQQELAERTQNLENTIEALNRQQGQKEQVLASLQAELRQQADEMVARQNASNAEVAMLEAQVVDLQDDYQSKLNQVDQLAEEIRAGESAMQGLQSTLEDNQAEIAALQSNLASTEEELQKALELEKDRRQVAQTIKQDFEQAGIKATVGDDGEVVIDFGGEYFDKGSHELKPAMKDRLRKAIPVYAHSLFNTATRSGQISAVEIIGFASPTYGGRPINPRSLSEENREAVNYNLDLSYERARSIFHYAFDTDTIEFEHQEEMLPLIKVIGRSFFTENVNPDDTGNLTQQEFCQLYDCNASQRVIIKFDLKEKETG